MEFECYHGTSAENADSIINNGYFDSPDDAWFGRGVYFFQSSVDLNSNGELEARNWVEKVKMCNNSAIFKAKIKSDKYIDLLRNYKHRSVYLKCRKKLFYAHVGAGGNKEDFKENVIFDYMIKKVKVDFIRVLVDATKGLGYNSYVVSAPQLQVCVKEKSAIIKNELLTKIEG